MRPIRGFVVRRMSEADLELALEWAAAEGWDPGLHDAHCFYAADPEGFFVGELDGAPIGCISAVRYGSSFGFLGLYIVKAERRGQGFGLELWRAALDHLGARAIGLDGVVANRRTTASPASGWRSSTSASAARAAAPSLRASPILPRSRSRRLRAMTRPLSPRRGRSFLTAGSVSGRLSRSAPPMGEG